MTKEKKKQSDKPLDKMTVKELREIAKEISDLTGVHAMKKEDLLVAIAAAQDTGETSSSAAEEKQDTPSTPKPSADGTKKKAVAKKEKAVLTVKEVKSLIKNLKFKRQQALSDSDSKMAKIYRRRISRLKKKSRKAA
jgi:hypothetical protein